MYAIRSYYALGRGAYKKSGDKIEWQGAVNALQKQAGLNVHVGGLSALEQHGYSHYFRLSKENLYLFSPQRITLPKWFTNFDWSVELSHKSYNFV